MQLSVSAEDFVAAIRRDWPLQAEITMLRLANAQLSDQVDRLGGYPEHRHEASNVDHEGAQ